MKIYFLKQQIYCLAEKKFPLLLVLVKPLNKFNSKAFDFRQSSIHKSSIINKRHAHSMRLFAILSILDNGVDGAQETMLKHLPNN